MKKSLLLITLTSLALSAPAMAVSCKSFATQAQAQQYFNAKKAGYRKLDRDRDGIACEANRSGSGKATRNSKTKKGKSVKRK